MTQIEKIRAEIERRMKIYKESNYGISLRYQELEELLSFLDTLQEPEVLPHTKDLEGLVAGRDFVPTEWVDTLDKYGKWKIVKQGQTERDMITKATQWLRDIYSQFDITDSNGYTIDNQTFINAFRKAMEGKK